MGTKFGLRFGSACVLLCDSVLGAFPLTFWWIFISSRHFWACRNLLFDRKCMICSPKFWLKRIYRRYVMLWFHLFLNWFWTILIDVLFTCISRVGRRLVHRWRQSDSQWSLRGDSQNQGDYSSLRIQTQCQRSECRWNLHHQSYLHY